MVAAGLRSSDTARVGDDFEADQAILDGGAELVGIRSALGLLLGDQQVGTGLGNGGAIDGGDGLGNGRQRNEGCKKGHSQTGRDDFHQFSLLGRAGWSFYCSSGDFA